MRTCFSSSIAVVAAVLVLVTGCAEMQFPSSTPTTALVPIQPDPDGRPITRVAIVVTEERGFPAAKAEGLLAEAFVQKGYTVASTADARQVLQEAMVRDTAYFDRQENTQRLGRMLKVDAIFHLRPTELKFSKDQHGQQQLAVVSASAKLIDAERASLRWVKNAKVGNDLLVAFGLGAGANSTESLISNIMSAFPPAQK